MAIPMEPEVHIIEKWFQEFYHCFTMTNIKLKGGKEIDLLAIDPLKEEYYHIESRVSISFKLRIKATYMKDGRCDRNGLDYFDKEKFEHPTVKKFVNQIFDNKPYHKILIVWDIQYCGLAGVGLKERVEAQFGIEVWSMRGIIAQLSTDKRTSGSRDDILRTMELVFLERKAESDGTLKIAKK
jgi:hypothetical protein